MTTTGIATALPALLRALSAFAAALLWLPLHSRAPGASAGAYMRYAELDTAVLGGVRLRQSGGTLTVFQAGRQATRVALDTVIRADGAFTVRLLDAVRTPAARILVLHVAGGANTRDPAGRYGAGTEEALLWLALGRDARPVRAQRVVVASCRTTREVDADTVVLVGDSLAVPFWDAGRDSTFVVRYSRRAADRGLVVRPAPASVRGR